MPASAPASRRIASSSIVLLLGIAAPACASPGGVYLPPAPTGPGGEDSIETSGGTRCRQSMNSNGTYVDVGVTGSSGTRDRPDSGIFYRDDRPNQATAYARVTIPIGPRPQRIDCSAVFQLEIARLKREVELLRMGAGR